jgi:hypothetical protein
MYEEFDECEDCCTINYEERRSQQHDLEYRMEELEKILKIKDFEEMKKKALEYEDYWCCTDIREDSTKEEIIESIKEEIESLESEWRDLD